MHFFIVRSNLRLEETVQKFQNFGHTATAICVLDIQYKEPSLDSLNNKNGIIFTSQHAVIGLSRKWQPSSQHHAFCIGEATALQAKQSGFQHIHIAENPQSASLVELVSQFDMPMTYVAGEFHKPHLENALKNNNISFNIIDIYTALPIDALPEDLVQDILQYQGDFVCFSIRNATVLYDLMQKSPLLKKIANERIWHIVGKAVELAENIEHTKFYDTPDTIYKFVFI